MIQVRHFFRSFAFGKLVDFDLFFVLFRRIVRSEHLTESRHDAVHTSARPGNIVGTNHIHVQYDSDFFRIVVCRVGVRIVPKHGFALFPVVLYAIDIEPDIFCILGNGNGKHVSH
jgi:hypothetical protein